MVNTHYGILLNCNKNESRLCVDRTRKGYMSSELTQMEKDEYHSSLSFGALSSKSSAMSISWSNYRSQESQKGERGYCKDRGAWGAMEREITGYK